jgi:hypothetical protein
VGLNASEDTHNFLRLFLGLISSPSYCLGVQRVIFVAY